ncbi:hypothetical protein ES703_101848 [subsurface metagenome]
MHRAARQKAHTKAKTDIYRGSVSAEPAEKKSSGTVIFWPLPWVVAAICDLNSGPKGLFAKMIFDAWGSKCCRVGVRLQAKSLGVDRGTIRRWLRELQLRGLIKIEYEWACCCYHLNPKCRVGGFIPLLAETMKRRDIGWSDKLVLCSMSYRQGDNDYCWAKQKEQAGDLGLSVRTIQRVIAGMKARGEVQIRLRGRNSKRGNKYALTCGAVLGGRVFGASSHTTQSPPLNKKRKAKISFKAFRPKFHLGDLSESDSSDGFGMEAVYLELVNVRIHEKVARPMAFDQHHPFESVVQAINNAQILRAQFWERSVKAGLPRQKFSVPGYVVNALNGARREGKKVGTTKLFRDTAMRSRAIKIAKAISAKRKPLSEAEFEARRRKAIRALGVGT